MVDWGCPRKADHKQTHGGRQKNDDDAPLAARLDLCIHLRADVHDIFGPPRAQEELFPIYLSARLCRSPTLARSRRNFQSHIREAEALGTSPTTFDPSVSKCGRACRASPPLAHTSPQAPLPT